MFTSLHLAKLLIYLRKKRKKKLNFKMPNVMFFLTCMNILFAYLFISHWQIHFFSSKYNYSKHVVVRVLYQFFFFTVRSVPVCTFILQSMVCTSETFIQLPVPPPCGGSWREESPSVWKWKRMQPPNILGESKAGYILSNVAEVVERILTFVPTKNLLRIAR